MRRFPDNGRFAFTIVDDTDSSTVENIEPVYRLLAECGFKTTKTVWSLPNVPGAPFPGGTLQDADYRAFILSLIDKGFEIGLHNVRNSHSTRDVIERGLHECEEKIGILPQVQINHFNNRENLYWGRARFTTFPSNLCYGALSRLHGDTEYDGHLEGSPYFWGDLCRERIRYVRSFVLGDINLQKFNPTLPYRNPAHPYVNYWFTSSFGSNVTTFCQTLREANQDRLEEEGGVCIMYTHFASGFVKDGRVDPRFTALMRRLAKKDGWFVPVTALLDHLKSERTDHCIPPHELRSLESRWLRFRITNPAM